VPTTPMPVRSARSSGRQARRLSPPGPASRRARARLRAGSGTLRTGSCGRGSYEHMFASSNRSNRDSPTGTPSTINCSFAPRSSVVACLPQTRAGNPERNLAMRSRRTAVADLDTPFG
jgi:hypothetical protein